MQKRCHHYKVFSGDSVPEAVLGELRGRGETGNKPSVCTEFLARVRTGHVH